MWDFLSRITITCFAASYGVALALEVSRLFFRAPVRVAVSAGFTIAGLVAQLAYLVVRAVDETATGTPLSNWYDWTLIVSWVLATCYLVLLLRRPQAAFGLFVLPLVLALIAIAVWVLEPNQPPSSDARSLWATIHGMSLLVGTVSVLTGFAAGVMYLAQSYRLKHKLPPRQGFQLPSLEWLNKLNERSLLVSTLLLAFGFLSGIVLNIYVHGQEAGGVPWSDPIVWTSALLFSWVLIATIFNLVYKPARLGKKVAYLTVANFCFLLLVLYFLLSGQSEHPNNRPPEAAEESAATFTLPHSGRAAS